MKKQGEKTFYDLFEDRVIELLKTPAYIVGPAPDEEKLNDGRVLSKPQLYVIISGDDWDGPSNLGLTNQPVTVKAEIFMRAKQRRGTNGIYGLYDYTIEKLLGVKLEDAETPITFVELRFVQGKQNKWEYGATFTFDVRRIAKKKKDEGPQLKELIIKDTIRT